MGATGEDDPVLRAIDDWLAEVELQEKSARRHAGRSVYDDMKERASLLRSLYVSGQFLVLSEVIGRFHRWVDDSMPWEGDLLIKAEQLEKELRKAVRGKRS